MSDDSRETSFKGAVKFAHERGVFALGHKGLTAQDFKSILECLASLSTNNDDNDNDEEETGMVRREYRPRKCRRLDGVAGLVTSLTTAARSADSRTIWKLNVVGNKEIGDKGTEFLHLLPSTIRDLDLSACNLSAEGIENVCQFMETNRNITRLIMWGNPGMTGVRGRAWLRMLARNDTLEELCIWPEVTSDEFTLNAITAIAVSLRENGRLRVLDALQEPPPTRRGRALWSLAFSDQLVHNNTLERLSFGHIVRDCPHFWDSWETCLETNEALKSLDPIGVKSNTIRHYLALNTVNARMVVRDDDIHQNPEKWLNAIIQAAKSSGRTGEVHSLYFLLRADPSFAH